MGSGLVSFLLAIGSGGWIYARLQRTSGNNTQRSATAAIIAALFIFIILYFILKSVIK